MKVEVLGPLRVEVAGAEVSLGGPQQRLVFALLVVASPRVVTTDQLMDRLWAGDLPDNARKTVQVHVSKLRRALGDPDLIHTADGGYYLTDGIHLDVDEFERIVDEGRGYLADRPEKAGSLLRQALSLWRGSPYADLGSHESLLSEVGRLEELRLGVVEDRLAADIATGRAAVAELEVLIGEYPLRERLRALHMTALYRSGRQAEALGSYHQFRTSLTEALGLDPSPELQGLELQILQQDPALGPALPRPIAAVISNPIPARYTSFVGRDLEASKILDLLETNRLVTLVGPGGIGKSSLASETLHRASQNSDAHFVWIDIETTETGGIAVAVAQAMGLLPGPSSDAMEVIVGYAGERNYVLLLDGCEPLIDEAAAVVDRLLRECPQMRIFSTSREPLGLSGETPIRLGSLTSDEARSLFLKRAGLKLDPTEQRTIDQIEAVCAALDGIPLAIELAAARLRSMPLERLVQRLDDQVDLLRRSRSSDGRHGSLTAALEWSYRLLDEQQQRLFRMLSVFRQRFETGAAVSIAGGGHDGANILERLVEVSLIQPPDDSGFYRMLEPIKQYSSSLLEDLGEQPEARGHHAVWIVRRCGEIGTMLGTKAVFSAIDWGLRNRFELAAALEWLLQTDEPDGGVAIIAVIGREIANQGYGAVVLPYVEKIVSHPDVTPSRDLATAMAHTTLLLHFALDNEAARGVIDRAETMARTLDDPVALGRVLLRKAGFVGEAEGDRPELLEMSIHAASLLEEAGHIDPLDYYNVALHALFLGEIALAKKWAHKCLAWEKVNLGRSMGEVEAILAQIAVLEGDLAEGIRLMRIAATGRTEANVIRVASSDWEDLAALLTCAERYEEAAEALDMADQLGAMVGASTFASAAPRMRIEAAAENTDAVLRVAGKWFDSVLNTPGALDINIPDRHVLLYGEIGLNPSPFLKILLPLTQALLDRGQTDACQFAHAAAALMDETPFMGWDAIGEPDRWQQLADRCVHPEHTHPIEMSLEQAFGEAAQLLDLRARPT